MKRTLLLGLGAVCIVLSVLVAWRGGARSSSVDVLITVAGLRSDVVTPDSMPALAALAEQGTRVDVMSPMPDTVPSLVSLFSGRRPEDSGARFGDLARVPHDVPVLLDKVRDDKRAHSVAAVGQGEVSLLSGLYRDFHVVLVPSTPFDQVLLADETELTKARRRGLWSATAVADLATKYVRLLQPHTSAFFWVHFGELEAAARSDDAERAYGAALTEVDAAIDTMRRSLMTSGLAHRTRIMVVSTHGEALDPATELGHGLFLSDATIRVPAVVHPPDPRWSEARSHRDLHDVIAGVPVELDEEVSSRSYWPRRLYGWPESVVVVEGEGVVRRGPATEGPGESERPSEVSDGTRWRDEVSGLRTLREGAASFRGGDPVTAAQLFAETTRRMPGAPVAHASLLRAHGSLKGKEAHSVGRLAESSLEALTSLAEGNPVRQIDLARLLIHSRRVDLAAEAIAKVAVEELDVGGILGVVEVLADLQLYDRARELLVGVIEAGDDSPELHEWLGDLHRREGNSFRARLAYERALESPRARSGMLRVKLADALDALGAKDEALGQLARAVKEAPWYRYPHRLAASILIDQERFGAAADAAVKSLAAHADPREDVLARGEFLTSLRLYQAAVLELAEGHAALPGSPRIAVALSRAWDQAGVPEKAREVLESAVERLPSNASLRYEQARRAARDEEFSEALSILRETTPVAGKEISAAIRSDPLFVGSADEALARFAASFSGERRDRRSDTEEEAQ